MTFGLRSLCHQAASSAAAPALLLARTDGLIKAAPDIRTDRKSANGVNSVSSATPPETDRPPPEVWVLLCRSWRARAHLCTAPLLQSAQLGPSLTPRPSATTPHSRSLSTEPADSLQTNVSEGQRHGRTPPGWGADIASGVKSGADLTDAAEVIRALVFSLHSVSHPAPFALRCHLPPSGSVPSTTLAPPLHDNSACVVMPSPSQLTARPF